MVKSCLGKGWCEASAKVPVYRALRSRWQRIQQKPETMLITPAGPSAVGRHTFWEGGRDVGKKVLRICFSLWSKGGAR